MQRDNNSIYFENYGTATAVQKASALETSLDGQGRALDELAKEVEGLENRLSGVMSPDFPSANRECEAKDPSPQVSSRVVDQIRSLTQLVNRLTDRVRKIDQRLDV